MVRASGLFIVHIIERVPGASVKGAVVRSPKVPAHSSVKIVLFWFRSSGLWQSTSFSFGKCKRLWINPISRAGLVYEILLSVARRISLFPGTRQVNGSVRKVL